MDNNVAWMSPSGRGGSVGDKIGCGTDLGTLLQVELFQQMAVLRKKNTESHLCAQLK